MIRLIYFVAIWGEESVAAEIPLDGVGFGHTDTGRAVKALLLCGPHLTSAMLLPSISQTPSTQAIRLINLCPLLAKAGSPKNTGVCSGQAY
jgi:hypothetical protein